MRSPSQSFTLHKRGAPCEINLIYAQTSIATINCQVRFVSSAAALNSMHFCIAGIITTLKVLPHFRPRIANSCLLQN